MPTRKKITENEPSEEILQEEVEELIEPTEENVEEPEPLKVSPPTNKHFVSEEDRKLMRKFIDHTVKKLNLTGTRSFRI